MKRVIAHFNLCKDKSNITPVLSEENFPWKFNLEYGGIFTKLFMYVSSRNMFPPTRNLQNRVHIAKSGRFLHLHTSPFFLEWRRCADQFQSNFSKNCYFRNNRVPGQFATCENLPLHRFQFNSQISIYFDIKQWFLSDIRKINIILSISMLTVKISPEKTLKETQ